MKNESWQKAAQVLYETQLDTHMPAEQWREHHYLLETRHHALGSSHNSGESKILKIKNS